MKYIAVPNLPEGPVGLAVVDGRISPETEKELTLLDIKLIKTHRHSGVYEAISYHPDIMLHHMGGDCIVYAPGTPDEFLGCLSGYGFKLIKGATELSTQYPSDIAYNVATVGKYFFHNLKYTDPVLIKELEKYGLEPLHVAQGYAKCSISVVGRSAIITSDAGIAYAAEKKGIEVLITDYKQNILLPGLDYGFIGGSSGLVGTDKWAVNGDAGKLASFPIIYDFLSRKNIQIISLSKRQVIDIGSIIPLMTY